MIAVGVFLRDQVFAGGDEVVEDILLFFEHAGAMPVFAKLSSAAQVGNGVDATVLHPEKHAAAETRRQRDVKAAVARQQCGVFAVLLDSLLAHDKHRNLRAVLRAVPHLPHVIGGRIDGRRIDLGPERAFHVAAFHVC